MAVVLHFTQPLVDGWLRSLSQLALIYRQLRLVRDAGIQSRNYSRAAPAE